MSYTRRSGNCWPAVSFYPERTWWCGHLSREISRDIWISLTSAGARRLWCEDLPRRGCRFCSPASLAAGKIESHQEFFGFRKSPDREFPSTLPSLVKSTWVKKVSSYRWVECHRQQRLQSWSKNSQKPRVPDI